MATPSQIDSRHNPRFKEWKRRARSPQAPDCPWVTVEGWKAVAEAAASRPLRLLLCSDPKRPDFSALAERAAEICVLPDRLLRDISSVESPQGVVAFFDKPVWSWEELPPRLLFVWELQDPGNLGTLLRTARAAGFGVLCGPGTASCFNSKTVRASAGAVFFTPFLQDATPEQARQRGYRLVAATAREGVPFWEADWTPPFAALVGNEGAGLEPGLVELAEQLVHIPMRPGSESLNAAVAGSLLMYEAARKTLDANLDCKV